VQATPFALERYAVIGDVHLRWVDKAAYELTLAALEFIKPTHVILNGDILDCTGLSKYAKDPDEVDRLQEEINAWERFVRAIRRIVGATVPLWYTLGNHEARLERYLQDNAPALRSLDALTLASLLKFPEYGVTFYRDEIVLAQRNLVVHHGTKVRNFAGLSAKAELEKKRFQVSSLSGHTHRMGVVYTSLPYSERVVGAWEGGCLHRLDAEYIPGGHPDWQHGMTVVDVRGKEFRVSPLLYLGNEQSRWTVYNGYEVRV
jgi:hypothetical protein